MSFLESTSMLVGSIVIDSKQVSCSIVGGKSSVATVGREVDRTHASVGAATGAANVSGKILIHITTASVDEADRIVFLIGGDQQKLAI